MIFLVNLNTCHPNMSFSFKQEKNGELPFLDIEVSRKKGKFITTVYRKLTFSVVYTHFESFLPTVYKFGMVFTLAYLYSVLVGQCFTKNLFSWSKFFLKKNRYPLSIIDNCFKTFVDKLFIQRPQLTKVEKKIWFLSLSHLREISLQTRTKIRKSLISLLNRCKLQIALKAQ